GSQLAQLKDLEKEQKPSTEVVEIINQKPQAGQATTLRYTPQPQIMNATRKAQLPQTGSKENQSSLVIASMFILVSGYLLHL
ncbi:LPXTG cell wall anchor domain-containing protein, partial [Streptococcus anginosus]|uniref:LPXTG cell wall anchor domain-containing protein n=3 Tax=Lactobacillales TaxID=186826 RepID=UPI002ED78611